MVPSSSRMKPDPNEACGKKPKRGSAWMWMATTAGAASFTASAMKWESRGRRCALPGLSVQGDSRAEARQDAERGRERRGSSGHRLYLIACWFKGRTCGPGPTLCVRPLSVALAVYWLYSQEEERGGGGRTETSPLVCCLVGLVMQQQQQQQEEEEALTSGEKRADCRLINAATVQLFTQGESNCTS